MKDFKHFNWNQMADFEKIFRENPIQRTPQTEVYQPIVIYNKIIKRGWFKKETIPIPFSCNKVFLNKEEANMFIGEYVKFLVKDGSLPAESIKQQDGKEIVNTDLVAVGITTLNILKLSKEF